MKPISTPQFRKRTDGVKFVAPPSAHQFHLPNIRFSDEKFVAQITYTLDDQDYSFLKRSASWLPSLSSSSSSSPLTVDASTTRNDFTSPTTSPLLTHRMLVAIMTAFEVAAYRELHAQDSKYQAQLQEINRFQQQQQQPPQQVGTTTTTTITSSSLSSSTRNSSTHGALEHSSRIVSSPNLPGILENVSIDLSLVLQNANITLPVNDNAQQQQRIYEACKGHWLEKRRATGTALLPVLRPVPYGNGIFGNKQLGEMDEPFTSREARNCLVLWRSSHHSIPPSLKDANAHEKQQCIAKAQRRQAQHDKLICKKVLNSAYALLKGLLEREEMRLAHAEILTAELAVTRKCRQISGVTFAASHKDEHDENANEHGSGCLDVPLVDVGPCAEAREKEYIQKFCAEGELNDSSSISSRISSSKLTLQQKEKEVLVRVLEENLF